MTRINSTQLKRIIFNEASRVPQSIVLDLAFDLQEAWAKLAELEERIKNAEVTLSGMGKVQL